jgi:hypothetical protein
MYGSVVTSGGVGQVFGHGSSVVVGASTGHSPGSVGGPFGPNVQVLLSLGIRGTHSPGSVGGPLGPNVHVLSSLGIRGISGLKQMD